jgi:hypothetical protein
MARNVLGGPSDVGRSNYQVALTVCEECGRGWQQGRGERIEVGSDVIEMAECDGQSIGHVSIVTGRGFDACAANCSAPTHVGVVEVRSEGGGHDPNELIVLCSAHHRAQHRAQLIIEGRVSTGLVFRHADGTSYGSCAEPRTVAMHLDAFRALRGLGFREGEAKMALEKVRAGEPHETTIQNVLRQALVVLADARDSRAPRTN